MPVSVRMAKPRLKVLIVGNGDSQLDLVRTVFRALGHQLIGAASCMHDGTLNGVRDGAISGALAPELYAEHRPDLVIVDLGSADGGGCATLAALRRIEDRRWVPIWAIGSGVDSEAEHVLALDAGAGAYLERPVSIPVLKARLAQVTRYMARQQQFLSHGQELQGYFEAAEEEIKAARLIMDRLLRTQATHVGVLQSWIAPAFKFSGDAVVAERSPDGSLKLLLADGVGHGLSAALNVLPVCRAFQSMAQKGFGLAALVAELNHTIRRDLPSHRFVAATLVNINAAEGYIEVWNGGNPACLMMDPQGDVVDLWPSRHLPLGVVDAIDLDLRADRRRLRADGQLVLFSDGAIEVADADGRGFGEAALIRALAESAPGVRLEALRFAVVEHLAGRPASDDVTLAFLDCAAEIKQSRARCGTADAGAAGSADETHAAAGAWEVSLVVESSRLNSLDLLPILQELVARLDPYWAHHPGAFAQLSERYIRALEQGLLKLDAGLKSQPEGQRVYALARADCLRNLGVGAVRITVSRSGADAQLRVGMHESMLGVGAVPRRALGNPGDLWIDTGTAGDDGGGETARARVAAPATYTAVATQAGEAAENATGRARSAPPV